VPAFSYKVSNSTNAILPLNKFLKRFTIGINRQLLLKTSEKVTKIFRNVAG
jgi:hypothetical protein